MREEIDGRFRSNLGRVRALVTVYEGRAGPGSGRPSVETADLLRAAVVFLHATMEDVLRSVLAWKWPEAATRDQFEDVAVIVGPDRKNKITLADLLDYRGASVDELIRLSIEAHLEKSNFNNLGEVKKALSRSGLEPTLVDAFQSSLAAMMARRHQIVHRADRNDGTGSGRHAAASLGKGTVMTWVGAVEGLCTAIVAGL